MRSEAAYQAKLIKKLQVIFPNCFVLKNDPDEYQGVPDLLVLVGDTWFMLEVKRSSDEPFQPNQPYYLDLFDSMSFAAVIFPENEEEVLDAIQSALYS